MSTVLLYLTLAGVTTTHSIDALLFPAPGSIGFVERGHLQTCVVNTKTPITFSPGALHIVVDRCELIFVDGFESP